MLCILLVGRSLVMSYDQRTAMIERDLKKGGGHLFKQISDARKSVTVNPFSSPSSSSSAKDERTAGKSEPDWSKFEAIFAKGNVNKQQTVLIS